MKTKLLFMCCLSIFFFCNGQEQIKLSDKNLYGKVKSVKELTYDAIQKFSEIIKVKEVSTQEYLLVFNKYGNLIEENMHDFNENFESNITYKYDENGNMLEIYNTYDEGFKNIYKYDINGHNIEMNFYDSNGECLGGNTPKYDERGDLIEEISFDCDRKFNGKIIYKYDSNRKNVEKNEYNSDESISVKTTYKYDDNGYLIERNNQKSSLDGVFNNKDIFKNDDKGNIIEKITVGGDFPGKTVYNYKYDLKGNWIKRITFQNDIPKNIDEREIEYFE